jgi:hypothetical protein
MVQAQRIVELQPYRRKRKSTTAQLKETKRSLRLLEDLAYCCLVAIWSRASQEGGHHTMFEEEKLLEAYFFNLNRGWPFGIPIIGGRAEVDEVLQLVKAKAQHSWYSWHRCTG